VSVRTSFSNNTQIHLSVHEEREAVAYDRSKGVRVREEQVVGAAMPVTQAAAAAAAATGTQDEDARAVQRPSTDLAMPELSRRSTEPPSSLPLPVCSRSSLVIDQISPRSLRDSLLASFIGGHTDPLPADSHSNTDGSGSASKGGGASPHSWTSSKTSPVFSPHSAHRGSLGRFGSPPAQQRQQHMPQHQIARPLSEELSRLRYACGGEAAAPRSSTSAQDSPGWMTTTRKAMTAEESSPKANHNSPPNSPLIRSRPQAKAARSKLPSTFPSHAPFAFQDAPLVASMGSERTAGGFALGPREGGAPVGGLLRPPHVQHTHSHSHSHRSKGRMRSSSGRWGSVGLGSGAMSSTSDLGDHPSGGSTTTATVTGVDGVAGGLHDGEIGSVDDQWFEESDEEMTMQERVASLMRERQMHWERERERGSGRPPSPAPWRS